MKNPEFQISNVYIEKECADQPYTREILARLGNVKAEVLPDRRSPEFESISFPKSLTKGKTVLYLCRNRGKFFKPCPATREYRCCDYRVLNIGANCPMDCVYCILQAYLNNPWLSFYVNIDDLFAELDNTFEQNPDEFFRIGTGEFTDSLALDNITHLSKRLVEYFKDENKAVLELKTKTAVIDQLRGLDHGGRTITAWSLNAPEIVAKEELRTASLEERLLAARQCADWGYKIAFHFDPIIYFSGWERGYAETIARLFQVVPREKIAWISLGCLRFLPPLKSIAAARFPNSKFFYEEFVTGLDGKFRYFRTLRVEMYKTIYNLLKENADPKTCIYLCMESDEIWQDVFGYVPEDKGGLRAMLDNSVTPQDEYSHNSLQCR